MPQTMARVQAPVDSNARGIAYCLLAMLVFAAQDAITKTLVKDYAIAQFVMIRYWVFAAFALMYVQSRGGLRPALRTHHPLLQLVRSTLSIVEIGVFALGLKYLGLAESHALFAVFPLVTLVLGGLFFSERVTRKQWLAAVVGFMGTLVILRPGLGVFDTGALIPLSAALMFAVYNLMTRRISRQDSFNTNMLYMALVGAGLSTAAGVPGWKPVAAGDWPLMLTLAMTGVFAHLLLVKALEYAPATTLQPFNYSLLVFAIVIGYLVFGSTPDLYTVLGAALVVAAGWYAFKRGGSAT
ncbi:DMT family transporter [Pseudomonas vanderleydeniana]|uniref:DMT family transporter n=1 Tax=Pseudomonas vanderleydeniana TaxID=2745495 RepID=A0A9E6TPQ5_9PSED|nr:DMT family transporter [Pseudomonas vanderleydeniana]QXI25632.1 DMT family transporter [Pseudomonas vanderleydeniana]